MWTTAKFCGNLLGQRLRRFKCLNSNVFPAKFLICFSNMMVKNNQSVNMKFLISVIVSLVVFERVSAQTKVVKFEEIASIMATKSDAIQVINFWATWCAPCVKELPYFQAVENRNDPSVKITLVSMDYADKLQNVNSFIKKKRITSDLLLLDNLDYNSWIDRVDESWGGAIPATLFINPRTGERKFVERELKDGELDSIIDSLKTKQ